MVNEGLPDDDHLKNKLFLPEVVRQVAKKNNDADLLGEDIRLYESLDRNSLT